MQLGGYSCLAPCEVVLQCVSFGQHCWSEFLISAMVPVVGEPVGWLGSSQVMLSPG